MKYKMALALLWAMVTFQLSAREITGYVREAENKTPIPYANIIIKGTMIGTMTDESGFFRINASDKDTLQFSSVGFNRREILVKMINELPLNVDLAENVQMVSEVTVKPEIPRAIVLFNQIQEHKKENIARIDAVDTFKTLTHTTVYVAIDTASGVAGLIENINDVTVESNNQQIRFTPIYLLEESANYTNLAEEVVYKKEDGIFPKVNMAINSLILINFEVDIDFYRDQVYILERGFISPLSKSALGHYNLYLNDSTYIGDKKYYHFTYSPKNKYNQLFSGSFVIEDSTFALTGISAYIAEEANINFLNGFESNITYGHQPDGQWFYDNQRIQLNLSLRLNKDSLSKYSSQRLDKVASGNWLINKEISYSTSKRLNKIKPSAWQLQPEFEVDSHGDKTFTQIGQLKEQKIVKGVDAIGGAALTSFFNLGKIDVGPIFDVYSTNTIEGSRISLPLRTSEKLSKRFTVGGYLGYGTLNEEFKFGANIAVQPKETDKFLLRFAYYNDYILVTQDKYLRFIKKNPNNRGNGNFIAIVTTRERNPFLKEEENYEFRVEYNTDSEFHFEASPYLLKNKSTPDVRFIRNGVDFHQYNNYGVLFNMKYAFKQHYDMFFFDRIYYMTPVPIINFSVDLGTTSIPGASEIDFGFYSHFHGSIQGRVNLGQVFLDYMVNTGYVFGDVPYDLLDQPVGSMSLGYSKYRYNLLHFASFAHNLYSNVHCYFNGGGILLNKLPLIKRLKLREILSFKMHAGTLSDSYNGVFDLPAYYSNVSDIPYAEIGVGLTNIFKVIRVEYVHLLGGKYKNSGFTDTQGIRLRTEIGF